MFYIKTNKTYKTYTAIDLLVRPPEPYWQCLFCDKIFLK